MSSRNLPRTLCPSEQGMTLAMAFLQSTLDCVDGAHQKVLKLLTNLESRESQ